MQARGGGQETPQVTRLLRLARQYEGLDWRTAAQAVRGSRLWQKWQATYAAGEMPDFSPVAPGPVPGVGSTGRTPLSSTACSPELTVTGCAVMNCTNMAGLSERSLKTYVCGGCMQVRFCSKACQRRAHMLHKQYCGKE